MARKAASKTKGRTPRQMTAPDPVATQTIDTPRRGRKPKQREEQPSEPLLADLFLPSDVEPGSEVAAETDSAQSTAMPPVEHDGEPTAESELAGATTDDAGDATQDVAPAKARRGRRPKAQLETESAADVNTDAAMPMMDASTEDTESVVSAEQPSDAGTDDAADDRVEMPRATPRRGRARKSESAPQLPTTQPEQGNDGSTAYLSAVDHAEFRAPATVDFAVHWDHRTDTVTFDWPAIERVAAVEGPNRTMAKLILAALAEGANSRWPF